MRAERRRAVAVLTACGLLLAGCASMPSDGGVKQIDAPQRSEADSQVRVFGVSPRKGELPRQIVRGFLEATTSEEADFDTARKYLTAEEAARWKPFARTTIVAGGPEVAPDGVRADSDGQGYTVEVTGTRVAEVDEKNAYTPSEGRYLDRLHLTQVKGEWRIDKLPDGLVMGEPDFERIYRSVNTYYFADLGTESGAVRFGRNVLVAEPVYLRRRIEPMTETVATLLKGPADWLKPVVTSAFPEGLRLEPGQQLSLDESGGLEVELRPSGRGNRIAVGAQRCTRMAAQLLHTVDQQSSARVQRVTLRDGEGQLCETSREEAQAFAPGLLNGPAARQYYLDDASRLIATGDDEGPGRPVDGPFGSGHVTLSGVAVSRDESMGAGVLADGRALYVAPLSSDAQYGEPALTSAGKRPEDRLTAPSWDGLGDLWIADRDPERPRLLRFKRGQGEPETVEAPGIGSARVESLRVAADGIRVALLLREDDRTMLKLGRIERGDTRGGEPVVRVTALRSAAPRLEDVTAVSWAGGSRLVLVGKEPGGVQQLRVVSTDGSAGNPPTLPGVNNVKGIAASEDEEKPLLADSQEGIVRLPRRDGSWQAVTDKGSAPVYPG
ncbi:LpqB family beta-propeller domain-containing protein [Streptomyces alkaliterrae]|uniref:Uncharacterized protein n=1 Tax=Streptomyces alkaliterrae TaxID=2213162 RepID=A0A5P0YPJ9_9ACTN|nr:LpqB family beta-propeller domain-containing protein [Streptomyces alkaliterrae]MBB1253792.1 hypothetical protein [Streptomyces alkaliterrae]MBB1260541.1 hypothetical protein [Streptomyces alkaliterrae]MQS02284.1 hypothetical protein [Streptomyces alkaliterrae]